MSSGNLVCQRKSQSSKCKVRPPPFLKPTNFGKTIFEETKYEK